MCKRTGLWMARLDYSNEPPLRMNITGQLLLWWPVRCCFSTLLMAFHGPANSWQKSSLELLKWTLKKVQDMKHFFFFFVHPGHCCSSVTGFEGDTVILLCFLFSLFTWCNTIIVLNVITRFSLLLPMFCTSFLAKNICTTIVFIFSFAGTVVKKK